MTMDPADKCDFCGNVGWGKGRDDYEHVHCRGCPTSVYLRSRGTPASGDTWDVYCTRHGQVVTVIAITVKNRDPPAPCLAPGPVFR